jgi:ABC-2 type transport system permease protein
MMEGTKLYLQQFAVMCRKEILAVWQDKATRLIIIVPCIILGFLFGYAANYNLEDAPYAIVDLSHSKESADLLAAIDGTKFFKRKMTLQNANQVEEHMDNGDVVMAVCIPQDFAKRLSSGQTAPVQVITDGRNTVIAGQAANDMGEIISRFNEARTGRHSPVTLQIRTWFNPNQITRWFFLPGIIGLLSFSQVFLLAGLSIAREREEGTFEQILVAPISEPLILLGKAIPPIIVGLIQCTILLLISLFWFKVPFAGSFVDFYVAIAFYVLSSTGLGLCVSSVSKNMQQVLVYVIVIMVPMALLSGIITPISNMPTFLQYLTYADPLRFGLELIRRIYLEGLPLSSLALNLIPLTLIAVIALTTAGYLFRANL